MNCPKCGTDFATVNFAGIQFERCTGCKGLWFDLLKKEDLQAMLGSESIDIGDARIGAEYNQNRDIDCPKCHVAMSPMIDKDQFHIQYEYCSRCFGTYFDAGEFRDLKEHSVVERFRQMLETLRTNLG